MNTLNGKLAICILLCTSSQSVDPQLQESNTVRPATYTPPVTAACISPLSHSPYTNRVILRCCYTLLTALTARQIYQQCVLHYVCHRSHVALSSELSGKYYPIRLSSQILQTGVWSRPIGVLLAASFDLINRL
jgi:hypothetical protein